MKENNEELQTYNSPSVCEIKIQTSLLSGSETGNTEDLEDGGRF